VFTHLHPPCLRVCAQEAAAAASVTAVAAAAASKAAAEELSDLNVGLKTRVKEVRWEGLFCVAVLGCAAVLLCCCSGLCCCAAVKLWLRRCANCALTLPVCLRCGPHPFPSLCPPTSVPVPPVLQLEEALLCAAREQEAASAVKDQEVQVPCSCTAPSLTHLSASFTSHRPFMSKSCNSDTASSLWSRNSDSRLN